MAADERRRGMVSAALGAARRAAERLMLTSCRIIRLHEVALDTASLNLSDVDPSDDGVYEGPCRLKTLRLTVSTADAEGQLNAVQQTILSLPASVVGVRVGDRVTITDGGPDLDLTDRRYRVAGLPAQTEASAHRYLIETETA